MFLDVLIRRNPAFVSSVAALHQAGAIPAGSYVLDLDAVGRNAAHLVAEGKRLGLDVLAMTKQVGRGAPFAHALRDAGLSRAVAVDLACARACSAGGLDVAHIGHLVQIPTADVDAAAALQPDYWTVFNEIRADQAAAATGRRGGEQALLARICHAGDRFYAGHAGGFEAADVVNVAEALDALSHARFAGVTTFPALLFDLETRRVRATPNLATLTAAADRLARDGRTGITVNAPGTTSTATLPMLADAGATQVEPGHALTGTTPLHAFEDLVETPAALFVSEISHHAGGRAYCFGGGLYVDPVFGSYPLRALILEDADLSAGTLAPAEIPPTEAIDYYGMLDQPAGGGFSVGATAIFGFRIQAFVTRAPTVGLAGVASGRPQVQGIWGPDGTAITR